jgi:hypothetical protein
LPTISGITISFRRFPDNLWFLDSSRLVDEGWLIFHDAENARNARSKRLTLGLRAMIDLQHFITTTWPEELCCVW